MGNTSSIALPTHPRPKRPTALSRLIGCGSTTNEQQVEETSFVDEKFFYNSQPKAIPALAYLTPYSDAQDPADEAYAKFLKDYPQYLKTTIVDKLRESEYTRLKAAGETYVDYTGGGMYPEKLTRDHLEYLNTHVLGNTHSVNNSSQLSMRNAAEARAAALAFFGASPEDYTVVFTPNATGALKLVGEAFPFKKGGSYVLSADSHNSVNGVRQFAIEKGADLVYIPTTTVGGMDTNIAKALLLQHKPKSKETPSLFILTAQSNATNSKNDLSLIKYAASLGYYTMLDTAAYVPCTSIILSEVGADAMCVSFYKMFGYPTGLGALVVKKTLLMDVLQRPWFGGGTIDLVQAPGTIMTRGLIPNERFEDGTINYASTKAITEGLEFLAVYQPYLPLRISCIMRYMWTTVPTILHDTGAKILEDQDEDLKKKKRKNGPRKPVAKVISREPGPALKNVDEHSETGTIIALLFYDPNGELLPISFIEFAAAQNKISLRTGCVCNPGGVAAMTGIQEAMKHLHKGMTKKEWEAELHHEVGMVRVSFGLVSNFHDAWNVLQFVATIGRKKDREALLTKWRESQPGTEH